MVRSIGADRLIDYTQEDFTRGGQRYDLLLDCIGNHSFSECRRILNPKGIHIVVGAPYGRWIGPLARMFKALVLSGLMGRRIVPFIAKPAKEDLTMMGELMANGKVTPVIDRHYKLGDAPQAIRYLEEGHARGKVVITMK